MCSFAALLPRFSGMLLGGVSGESESLLFLKAPRRVYLDPILYKHVLAVPYKP